MENVKWPASTVVLLAIFFSSIALMTFEALRHSRNAILSFMAVIFYLMFSFLIHAEYEIPGLKTAKIVQFVDGVVGVQETPIVPEFGGRSSMVVGVKPKYVSKDAWGRMPGLNGFLAALSGRVHVTVTRPTWMFEEIIEPYLGASEGCIRVHSGIDPDRPIRGYDDFLRSKLDYSEAVVSKIHTIAEKFKSQSAVDSKESSQSAVEAMQMLMPILREWKSAQAPFQPMLPGQGMMGGR